MPDKKKETECLIGSRKCWHRAGSFPGERIKDFPVLHSSEILCKENNLEYRLKNDMGDCISKVKIDGGLYGSDGLKRCDYGLFMCQKNTACLIELKGGRDIKKAIEQMLSTIEQLKGLLNNYKKLHVRIISGKGRCPNIIYRGEAALKTKCMEKDGRFLMKERLFEEKVSDL